MQKRRDIQCRRNEISQQQKNSSRAILTQIGHRSPVGWKPRARQQFSASKMRICSSRTVTRQFQLKSGVPPFSWKPRAENSSFSAGRAILRSSRTAAVSNQIGHAPVRLEAATTESREVRVSYVTFNTTHRDSEQPRVDKTSSRSSSSVQKKARYQQQNGGGVVSTQIGHTPVWLEAQGQTAVQCRKNEISQ